MWHLLFNISLINHNTDQSFQLQASTGHWSSHLCNININWSLYAITSFQSLVKPCMQHWYVLCSVHAITSFHWSSPVCNIDMFCSLYAITSFQSLVKPCMQLWYVLCSVHAITSFQSLVKPCMQHWYVLWSVRVITSFHWSSSLCKLDIYWSSILAD